MAKGAGAKEVALREMREGRVQDIAKTAARLREVLAAPKKGKPKPKAKGRR